MSVYTATLLEDLARREAVADMMRAGDWMGVMKTFQGGEERRDPLLLWIRPTISCLNFIKQELERLSLNTISSVGCGNGTLGEISHLLSVLSLTSHCTRVAPAGGCPAESEGVRGQQVVVGGSQQYSSLHRHTVL